MKLSLNRFDSETVYASTERYKQKFPLPDINLRRAENG